MSTIKRYIKYLWATPKLYKIYRSPFASTSNQPQHLRPPSYTPSLIDNLTTATISYVIPLTLVFSVYHRKLHYVQFAMIAYLASKLLQSLTRLSNPDYLQFLRILEKASESRDTESMERLRCYDFEFAYFPVLHDANVDVSGWVEQNQSGRESSALGWYSSWAMAHSFGIRLIYPGLLLGGLLKNVLDEGREKLVLEKGGVRVKVRAASTLGGVVAVDACVFDRRGQAGSSGGSGDILFLCCEGNAGFYEIGMMGGALSEGYSVLGWNHPGFGGSTGTPYPATELTAALGVMDYAMNVLGFKENQIVVYGWSIGGFPATYLANRFPNIRGLLLDATFDDILPLAIPRMPEFMKPLVVSTIRNHVNLQNSNNLAEYKGPIRIVRRTDDEIIADPPGVLKANRGNQLLVEIVLRRYGRTVSSEELEAFREWVWTAHDRDNCDRDCLSSGCGKEPASSSSSSSVRSILIGIASSILRDYKSTHCTPLPREYYRIINH